MYLKDNNELQKMVPGDLVEILQFQGIQTTQDLVLNSVKNYVIINQALKNETLNTFLVFLKEASADKQYIKFRNKLLKVKYDIIFVNKEIETEMLISNFDVMNFMFDSEITADILNFDDNLYNILKRDCGLDISTYQLLELLEVSDTDYDNEKNNIVAILRQAYMKSGFLLLDDNDLSDINYEFHELIEESYDSKEDNISISLIIKTFKNIKQDRKKYKISSTIDKKNYNLNII